MKFCTLASGSQGNSIFFEVNSTRILIDAGISGIELERRLNQINVMPSDVDAICVTHEHSDHVRSLAVLTKRFGIPIYITERTLAAFKNKDKIRKYVNFFEGGVPFKLGDFELTPFPIPHDAVDPHGFVVRSNGQRVAVATDMGYITNLIRHRLQE